MTAITPTSLFNQLDEQVKSLHLPDRPWYYDLAIARTFAFVSAAYGTSVITAYHFESLAAQIPAMFMVGFSVAQALLLAHDNEHGQMSRGLFPRKLFRRLVNILAMQSTASWFIAHNLHHAHSNDPQSDPDANIRVLAFDTSSAEQKRGLYRLMVKYQAYLFPVISCFTVLSIRITSTKYAFYNKRKVFFYELIWSISSVVLYITFMTAVLGSIWRALVFIVVADCFTGLYLGMAFSVNHRGMPMAPRGRGYLRAQVESSRNIAGSHASTTAIYSFLFGFLNFQIEHHIWPRMSRYKLSDVATLTKEFCAEHDINYTCCTLLGAFHDVFANFAHVGRHLRKLDRANRRKTKPTVYR